MSWLLFLDESGHGSQRICPRGRGGIALHGFATVALLCSSKWRDLNWTPWLAQRLHQHQRKLNGCSLLDRGDDSSFAAQQNPLAPEARRKTVGLLTNGPPKRKKKPTRDDLPLWRSLLEDMASWDDALLHSHNAVVFAAAIPCSVRKPSVAQAEEFLRKDQRAFLLERFFYFLEAEKQYGLLVMDEVESLMIGGSSGSWKLTLERRRQAAIEPVGLYLCHFSCRRPHVPNPKLRIFASTA